MPQTAQETHVEQILVVPTLLFHELGYFQGFTTNTRPYLKTLLDPAYTSFRPRDEMEHDPSFKQLIPYCIFRCRGTIFHYKRSQGQGEKRLHSKRSIGVGGHISSVDVRGGESPYREGLRRELAEEVQIDAGFTESCVGLINDDLTEVGKVHLGIVHIFDLDAPKVFPREESIIETGFADPDDLIDHTEEF
jgi:predicted NUDIX family phosphoesterase